MTESDSNNLQTAASSASVVRWAVVGIFIIMLVAGLAYAREFLMPVVLALLLQLVFSPVRRQLERLGLSSVIAATLIFTTLVLLIISAFYGLSSPVKTWIERAPVFINELQMAVDEVHGATGSVLRAVQEVEEITASVDQGGRSVPEVQIREESSMAALAKSLPIMLVQVAFTLVLLLLLLASGDMFYEKIIYVLPSLHDKKKATRIAMQIENNLSRYLFTITLINVSLGVMIGFSMWLVGMPTPIIFGIVGCLLNFIPYIGAVIGVLLVGAVGLVSFDDLSQTMLAAGMYYALTFTEGQVITPALVGRSLRLNTVVIFLTVTFFAWLWSVVGMLVATPLLMAARIVCAHVESLEKFGHFLSERGSEKKALPGSSIP